MFCLKPVLLYNNIFEVVMYNFSLKHLELLKRAWRGKVPVNAKVACSLTHKKKTDFFAVRATYE